MDIECVFVSIPHQAKQQGLAGRFFPDGKAPFPGCAAGREKGGFKSMQASYQPTDHQQPQALVNPNEKDKQVSDLLAMVRFIWSKKLQIIAVALICGILTFLVVQFLIPPKYEATKKLYIMSGGSSLVDLSQLQLGSGLIVDYSQVFKRMETHEEVRQRLGHDYTDKELDKMINVTNPSGTHIMVVTATCESEKQAELLVEAYTEVATKFIVANISGQNPPEFEGTKVLPAQHTLRYSAVAVLLGGILSCLVYGFYFFFDDKVHSRKELEEKLGLAVLSAVPPLNN